MERVLLQRTHALLMLGSIKICWTPGPWASVWGGSRREATMAVGSLELSLGSGGSRTKCRISAADVPT